MGNFPNFEDFEGPSPIWKFLEGNPIQVMAKLALNKFCSKFNGKIKVSMIYLVNPNL